MSAREVHREPLVGCPAAVALIPSDRTAFAASAGTEAYDGLMSIRIESYDGGDALYVAIDPDGTWARSAFPDELVTIDCNAR